MFSEAAFQFHLDDFQQDGAGHNLDAFDLDAPTFVDAVEPAARGGAPCGGMCAFRAFAAAGR